jgi:peptidoglycan/LPS O-acetylase OafA/YrhL
LESGARNGWPKIPALDGFRGYALIGLVGFHMLTLSATQSERGGEFGFLVWGAIGGMLDVFFIVSGCGLFLAVVMRGGMRDVRRYARKRAARIFPSYWVTLTVSLVLLLIVQPAALPLPSPGEALIQYTGLQEPARLLDPTMQVAFGNPALWMISVLIGLYILLPLVAGPFLRHPLIGLALAAAITVGWKLAVVHWTGLFEAIGGNPETPDYLLTWITVDQLPAWLYSFALGMTCAWAYVRFAQPRPREQLERLALRALPFVLIAFGLCTYLYTRLAVEAEGIAGGAFARTSPFLGIATTTSRAALIAVIVLGPALLARPFVNRPLRALTELSYGIYLFHLVAAVYLGVVVFDLPQDGTVAAAALWTAVVLPPSIAFAYLVTRFVERPARAWAERPRPAATDDARAQSPPRRRDPAPRIPAESGRA